MSFSLYFCCCSVSDSNLHGIVLGPEFFFFTCPFPLFLYPVFHRTNGPRGGRDVRWGMGGKNGKDECATCTHLRRSCLRRNVSSEHVFSHLLEGNFGGKELWWEGQWCCSKTSRCLVILKKKKVHFFYIQCNEAESTSLRPAQAWLRRANDTLVNASDRFSRHAYFQGKMTITPTLLMPIYDNTQWALS